MPSLRPIWLAAVAAAIAEMGCATSAAVVLPRRELVLGYDDAHPSSALTFPKDTYETVLRFEVPAGEHKPLRLRLQAEAVGKLEITIYNSTPLETPGVAIRTLTRELGQNDLSDGRDGRWVVEDLGDVEPLKGTVWVGVHRLEGQPSIWASSVVSGQTFVRDNDPTNPMGLLPTKRTPMIRLELEQ